MKRSWPKVLVFAGTLLGAALVCAAADSRFTAVEIYLESAEPVAAWQFEFGQPGGSMKVVGVENGESAAFHGAPYYDREAVQSGTADRIVVADYSLAATAELPSGRTRIATLHLMIDGKDDVGFHLELVKAVAPDGRVLEASIGLRSLTGNEP